MTENKEMLVFLVIFLKISAKIYNRDEKGRRWTKWAEMSARERSFSYADTLTQALTVKIS